MEQKWQQAYEDADKDYQVKLNALWEYADFIRKELLLRIVPEQLYAEDKKDFKSRTREDAAKYLENLAKRVPPPKMTIRSDTLPPQPAVQPR